MEKAATYTKKIQASTENLAEVREFVSKHATDHGFSKQNITDIRLAVDEACTNIIKHAYKYDKSKVVSIELEFEDDQLIVLLKDNGVGFNPDSYEKPNLPEQIKKKKRGGMGVHLMKNLMDKVIYKNIDGKNILYMCKNRDQSF
ncbi:MAG: ATP-binding protein [Balneolaceae bacterium]|nr:MAG: ATP-binding protein [Balneolaceae bacterium]